MLKFLSAALASLAVATTVAPEASAADRPPMTIVGHPSSAATASVGAQPRFSLTSAEAAQCVSPGDSFVDRTSACAILPSSVPIVTDKGTGTLQITTTHDITLNVTSRTYTDNVSITFGTYIGTASISGLTFSLQATCTGTCTSVASSSTQNIRAVPGTSASGTVTFTDTTTTRNSSSNTFVYRAGGPGFSGKTNTVTIPTIRCDDELSTQQAAGCVFPGFTPTLWQGSLPTIGSSIASIQAAGHWGEKGFGKPLHRLRDETQQRANREAVCPSGQTPPEPGFECDEYPFAATYEGGLAVPADERGAAWVPSWEQRSQGGLITTFNTANRVLDNDAFWVGV